MFARLDNWNDTSVYKGKDGRVIPEYLYFMLALKAYYNIREKDEIKKAGDSRDPKHQASDYEREF